MAPLEDDKAKTRARLTDFAKMSEILDQDKLIEEPEAKRRQRKKDAVEKLTQKVGRFKKVHSGCEYSLERVLKKIDLDKFILLKERLTCAWNESLYDKMGDLNIRDDLRKLKAQRQARYLSQVAAYDKLLEQLKVRDCIPVAEEKMLLDGLKLILDNGWTVGP